MKHARSSKDRDGHSKAGRSLSRDSLASALFSLHENLRVSLWLTPSLFIGGAIAFALGLAAFDNALGETAEGEELLLIFSGGPESARAVLSAIATSILSLTALVFSITVLVLQLTSSQYSSRALRTFLRDRTSKVTMGVFLGTFTFALLGLRAVRGGSENGDVFVPGTTVTGALVLTLVSLYVFLVYIHHMSRRIQAASIISAIAEETVHDLERLFPEMSDEAGGGDVEPPETGPPLRSIISREGKVVVSLDEAGLVTLAKKGDCCFRMLVGVGDFVVRGQPLAEVIGNDIEDREFLKHLHFGEDRSMEQDLRFGLRQLVDIALRSLSPGINDPSTAVQAVDRLHDLLRRLGMRKFPDPARRDDAGTVRLVRTVQEWDSFVRLAAEEITHYGKDSPEVRRRLAWMRDDLTATLPPERTAVLRAVGASLGWEDL